MKRGKITRFTAIRPATRVSTMRRPVSPSLAHKPVSRRAAEPDVRPLLARFVKAFGHDRGAKYLLEGLAFSQAQKRHEARKHRLLAGLSNRERFVRALATSGK